MDFLKAVVLGFLIAAPVGPIGLLCISRALEGGWPAGFASGLGAATADACYALAAMLGLIAVSASYAPLRLPLRVAGVLMLIYLGVKTLRDAGARAASGPQSAGLLRMYLSTFALTFVNPATIASFVAIFAAAGLGASAPLAVVAGVFTGSAAWWLILGVGVGALRARVPAAFVRWTHTVSGVGLIVFAFIALVLLATHPAAAQKKSVVIGVDLPLAGRDGARGIMAEQGVILAVDDANRTSTKYVYHADVRDTARGGIQNPHVDKGVDNIYDPPHANASLRAWAKNPAVAAVLGPLRDNIARAEAPLARELGFALVSGSLEMPLTPAGNVFSTAPRDGALGEAAARAAWSLGFRRVRAIDGGAPHGSAAASFARAFARRGGTLASDLRNEDAVFFAGPVLQNAMLFTPDLAPVLLAPGPRTAMHREEFYGPTVLAQHSGGRYFEIVAVDAPPGTDIASVRARYAARFLEAPAPEGLRFYVAARALIAAIESAQSPDRHSVLARLRAHPPAGTYSYEIWELRKGILRKRS